MWSILRFAVGESEPDQSTFIEAVGEALAVLATRPGYVDGHVIRAYEDPRQWCLVTRWESVGAYRRAISSYDVKIVATGLLARALPEPSAYESIDLPGSAAGSAAGTAAGTRTAAEPSRIGGAQIGASHDDG